MLKTCCCWDKQEKADDLFILNIQTDITIKESETEVATFLK